MPAPISSEKTLVNTFTANDQIGTAITALPDGGWLVLWMSWGQDGSGYGVYGQRYSAAGLPAGAEFRINTTTTDSEASPCVTVLADGGWVVAWNSIGPAHEYSLYAQRYTDAGEAVGPEIRIDTAPGSQWTPSLAALSDGGWVIAWSSDDEFGFFDTYAQRFDSAGAPSGGEFRVNSSTTSYEYEPSVVALGDGGWVVAWNARDQDGSSWGVYTQRYTAAGIPLGGEVRVNTTTVGAQHLPSAAALGDGGWVVVWQSLHPDGSAEGIYAQRYAAAGTPIGTEVRISTTTVGNGAYPQVVATPDGGWAIGWLSEVPATSEGGYGLYVRSFNAAGSAMGGEIRVGTGGLSGTSPFGMAALPDGKLVVTWTAYDTGTGEVYARTVELGADPGDSLNVINGTEGDDFITGTPDDDQINGLGGNDTLVGLAGDDEVNGGGGDDLLQGGPGNDQLDGGTGTDTASFAPGIGPVFADLDAGVASGGDGDDTLVSVENALGSVFGDQLFAHSGGSRLVGNGGDDLLVGRGGNDWLQGNSGNDNMLGYAGDDVVEGGDGNDLLFGDGDIHYDGPGGNDTLIGGAGNDLLRGGPGVDSYGGGDGFDRITFGMRAATQGVIASLVTQTVSNDGFGNAETMTSIEGLGGGTAFADHFTGDDNGNLLLGEAGDTLIGNGGNDRFALYGAPILIDGGTGIDTINWVSGEVLMLVPDSDGDGLAEFEVATRGAHVDLKLGMIVDDGFGNSGTLISIENIGGGSLADVLVGDDAANVLTGFEGDDLLEGGLGNDTLIGGGGIDTASHEHASGGVEVDLASGFATGADGDDTLSGIENVIGSEFNDFISGDGGNNALSGLGGDDVVYAGAGDDEIYGGDGDDDLDGGDGNDIVDGGEGDDGAVGGAGNDLMDGGAGNDTFFGEEGDDQVYGGEGHDFLMGHQGNDILIGGSGNDLLRGGSGDDVLDGGDGYDRVSFFGGPSDMPPGGVTVSLLLQGQAQNTGHGWDTLIDIEALSGTDFNDQLTGDHGANWLAAIGGNDTLFGNGGDDLLEARRGGDHFLDGGAGSDTVSLSDDIGLSGPATVSLLLQGAAQNTGLGMMTLTAIENLSGSRFDDVLTGDAGANVLAGGAGADTLSGGGGNDTLYGDGVIAADIAESGGLSGPITVFENIAAGNDVLAGGDGDDLLNGGGGDDVLTGGKGRDTFEFGPGSGNDVITDFEKKDMIDFEGVAGVDDFSDLVITRVGRDTLITWGDGSDSILLEDMRPNQIDPAFFTFG